MNIVAFDENNNVLISVYLMLLNIAYPMRNKLERYTKHEVLLVGNIWVQRIIYFMHT